MKKILLLLPKYEKELFIAQGFAKAFRELGFAVIEKDFSKLDNDEVRGLCPEFVFNCEKELVEKFDENFIDAVHPGKFVHFLDDISGLNDCKVFELINNFIFSSDGNISKKFDMSGFLNLGIDAQSYKTNITEYNHQITFAGKVNSLKRLKFLSSIIKEFGEISIFADIDDFNASIELLTKENLLDGFYLNLYKNSYKGYLKRQNELAKIYTSSRINLDLSKENCEKLNYRVFEVLASRGFLIAESNNFIKTYFENGKELEVFSTEEELNDKIRFYLQNLNIAEAIALNGRRRVVSSYTFKDRAKEIINTLKEKEKHARLKSQ